ncbi:MAG: MYXO-CTERM sorting domain-containing protein [Planctomycetota bacterium]|nr:MYXO-CTERM sorting domain-containing protein [Planctomycetota bacterium]
MKRQFSAVAVAAIGALVLSAVPAQAQVVSLYGDIDGFGFGAPQDVDGADFVNDFGGIKMHDYREADDLANAPLTDTWNIIDEIGGPWVHEYQPLAEPDGAMLHMYLAGIADIDPIDLLADGDVIYTLDFEGQNRITHVVDIPVPLQYIDGTTTFEFVGWWNDGFIMDYAELTITPAPSSLALLALSALLVGRRRR